MKAEHAQEREESQRIQLWAVVSAQTDPNPLILKLLTAISTSKIRL
jgi:hypothetical protein